MFRKVLPLIFSELFFQKLTAFGFLLFLGYILSDFLVLFFITFLFAYLFLELAIWLTEYIHKWGVHKKMTKATELALKYNNTTIIVTILYILFIGIVIFLFVSIIPQIILEIRQFIEGAPMITGQIQRFADALQMQIPIDIGLDEIIGNIINSKNLETLGQTTLGYIKNTGIILTKFMLGIILSYIFIIERKQIQEFLLKIQDGNFAFFYREYAIIAGKIGNGFGAILRAQSLIAVVNAILTSIGLLMISLVHGGNVFPFIFTLSLIVLVFGFIPVFGTFISGVPILIIAYGYGGSISVLLCITMIAVVHAVEAYFLNPRIVSSYVHIPVFVTFIILLIAEHFFGLIGLLIGVPLFVITLGFIEDIDKHISLIRSELYGHR